MMDIRRLSGSHRPVYNIIMLQLGLCDNGKTFILIMLYKIISITIIISINNDRILGIFLDFYNSKITLYTNMSVCFV